MYSLNLYQAVTFLLLFRVSNCQRRIVNGKLVETDLSFMVYIVKASVSPEKYDEWLCGGALVTYEFIITSAACLKDVKFMYAIAGYNKYVPDSEIATNDCTNKKKKKIIYKCFPKIPDKNDPHWVKFDPTTDEVPEDAIVGGYEDGILYIIRASHEESMTTGKFVASTRQGLIPWGGESHLKTDLEILCGYNYKWVPGSEGYVPEGAVIGGYSEINDQETMYIGRASHEGHIIPGKVHQYYLQAYIPYGELEIAKSYYDVLVHDEVLKPEYNTYELNHERLEEWSFIDIGVAQLESPIDPKDAEFASKCSYLPKPIQVNYEEKYQAPATDAMVLGWGHKEIWRQESDTANHNQKDLHYASVSLAEKEECKKEYTIYPEMNTVIDKYMICSMGPGNVDSKGEMKTPLFRGCARRSDLSESKLESCEDDTNDQMMVVNFRKQAVNNTKFNIKELLKTDKNNTITFGNMNTRRHGICQNDHGGPIVTWVDGQAVLIGVASVFKVSKEWKCEGPYLYTSTKCNKAFLDCVLTSKERRYCDSNPEVKGYKRVETNISWVDHPDGPSDKDRHLNLKSNLNKSNSSTTASSINLNKSHFSTTDSSINLNKSNSNTTASSIVLNKSNYSMTDSSINLNKSNSSTTDSSINLNKSNSSTTDSSINLNKSNSSMTDSSINLNKSNSSTTDSSINLNKSNSSTTDSSINLNKSNSSTTDSSINLNKSNSSMTDSSINLNKSNSSTTDSSINLNKSNSSTTDSSINLNKSNSSMTDSSINLNKSNSSTTDSSINLNKSNSFTTDSSINLNKYNSSTTDSSINLNKCNSSTTTSNINLSLPQLLQV